MTAMTVQVRVSRIDDSHQNFGDIDTSRLGRFNQVEHQRKDYGNKNTSTEENHRHYNIGIPYKGAKEVAEQEKDQQHTCNGFPDAVASTPCGKDIVRILDKKEIPDDVYHHQNRA